MIEEPYFFEIPVYRCSREEYWADIDGREAKVLDHFYSFSVNKSRPKSDILRHYHSSIWKPYDYNEIVGYIGLYVLGTQIRGHYYFIKGRVTKNRSRKRFEEVGKAFEHSIYKELTSDQIFEEIIEELRYLGTIEPFKNRHIDMSSFLVMGAFMDWRLLVDKLNSFPNPRIKP